MNARGRVARYRAQMRAKGLRAIEVWVPDTTRPGFAEEVRRQAEILSQADQRENIMVWVESVSTDWHEEQ